MADFTQLTDGFLKYAKLSQAAYHDGGIDVSNEYTSINIKQDTYEGYSATLLT